MRNHFRVPISAYLKKWVCKKILLGQEGPIKVEEDTLLGKQFMSVILDARKKDVIDKHIQFTEFLEVELSQAMMKRSPKIANLVTINFFLDKSFKQDMIAWVLSANHYGIRPHTSTKDFLAFYEVEESEYSHDGAYKYFLRWKNSDYAKSKKQGDRCPKIGSPTSYPVAA